MSKTQILILSAVALLLVLGILLTWGSVGSVLLAFMLMIMGPAILVQRYLTNRDDDDWKGENYRGFL